MLRYKSFSGNQGSDQSISDENEEQDRAWPGNFASLAGTLDHKKESLGVASQLELLKGDHQKDICFSSEDEVEMPDFHDKSNLDGPNNIESNSDILKKNGFDCKLDERMSNYEGSKILFNSVKAGAIISRTLDHHTRGKDNQFEACTWSRVDKNAKTLVRVGKKVRCPANHPSCSKGGRPKTKTRLSSHFQPHKQAIYWSPAQKDKDPNTISDYELLDETEAIDYRPMDNPTSELLGGLDGEKMSEPCVQAVSRHDNSRNSMVELLDDLRGKNTNPHLKPNMGGRRKGRMSLRAGIRSISSTRKDIMSEEDPCELMHSGSSTENEENAQNPELPIVESRRKTMADKFQEAFGSAVVDDTRPSFTVAKQSSSGLFGRLQRVIQCQKERDAEFLQKLQTEVWSKDEASCIDVKILSRSFDAKLTVCSCSLLENEKNSLENPGQENFGKIWTIIFSSRVCGDVDLEVGKFVRVHPPWKEVQVLRGGEIMILTTYFSQIYT